MEFLDLVNISEQYLELASPTTADKLLTLGRYLRLQPGSRAIDYACAYAEALVLWAEAFGVTGVGVELREHACRRARDRIAERGLADRIEVICCAAEGASPRIRKRKTPWPKRFSIWRRPWPVSSTGRRGSVQPLVAKRRTDRIARQSSGRPVLPAWRPLPLWPRSIPDCSGVWHKRHLPAANPVVR